MEQVEEGILGKAEGVELLLPSTIWISQYQRAVMHVD